VARRTLEYACAVLVIGLLAGVAGAATTLLLHAVEHLTYHYAFGTLLTGVGNSSPVRRAVGPMLGGALTGFGWWILRRSGDVPGLTATIAEHRPILVDDREFLVLGQQLLEGGDHLFTKRTVVVEVLDDGQVGIACTGRLQPGFRKDGFFAGSRNLLKFLRKCRGRKRRDPADREYRE